MPKPTDYLQNTIYPHLNHQRNLIIGYFIIGMIVINILNRILVLTSIQFFLPFFIILISSILLYLFLYYKHPEISYYDVKNTQINTLNQFLSSSYTIEHLREYSFRNTIRSLLNNTIKINKRYAYLSFKIGMILEGVLLIYTLLIIFFKTLYDPFKIDGLVELYLFLVFIIVIVIPFHYINKNDKCNHLLRFINQYELDHL
jgi:hypothetical protein